MNNLDNFIVGVSKQIVYLKNNQIMNGDINESKKIFDQLFQKLLKRKKFALDQYIWKELYTLSLYFYNNTKYIGDIPIVMVTKHNDIVPWYMQQFSKKQSTDTILHFDTHADMNPIKNSILLPGNKNIQEIQNIVWDIGAAISGTIFTTGQRDYVWCMPSWLPDKNIIIDYFLKPYRKIIKFYTNTSLNDNTIDINFTNKINGDKYNKNIYSKIRTGRLTDKQYRNMVDLIKKNGNTYILDIDLDYFVCNGSKIVDFDDYFEDPFDVQSFYRTEKIYFNQDIPRETTDIKSAAFKKYNNNLNKEIQNINKRIKDFLHLIKSLKKDGLTPSLISICDSTNIMFQDCQTCNSISNGYVPDNLALLVHYKIFEGLQKLFNN